MNNYDLSPLVKFGKKNTPKISNSITIPYDDTYITVFRSKRLNSSSPLLYREWLINNQVGSVFDLESGELLSKENNNGIFNNENISKNKYI